jgi:hypothetical protein
MWFIFCVCASQIAEQIVVYQQNLKQKQKQLRAMELELEMFKGQVGESKREIERVNGTLDALQKQFVKKAMGASAAMPSGPFASDPAY